MAVNIDKAGGDNEATGVENVSCLDVLELTNRAHPAGLDADVSKETRATRPIHHSAVADDDVKHWPQVRPARSPAPSKRRPRGYCARCGQWSARSRWADHGARRRRVRWCSAGREPASG